MALIFISHVSEDKPRLTPYILSLLELHYNVWIDRPAEVSEIPQTPGKLIGIPVNAPWRRGIEEGLQDADAVIIFWSNAALSRYMNASTQSGDFSFEVDAAVQTNKAVHLSLDGPSSVPREFQHIQWVPDIQSSDRLEFSRQLHSSLLSSPNFLRNVSDASTIELDLIYNAANDRGFRNEALTLLRQRVAIQLGGHPALLARSFPVIGSRQYPVLCLRAANSLKDSLFALQSRLETRNPVLFPDAGPSHEDVHPWITMKESRRRYYNLLTFGKKVIRPNMPGYAISQLELDARLQVVSFTAKPCSYMENSLSSHLPVFEMMDAFAKGVSLEQIGVDEETPQITVKHDSHHNSLHLDFQNVRNDYVGLISVQAITLFSEERYNKQEWYIAAIKRSRRVSINPGVHQFVPAGGFECSYQDWSRQFLEEDFDIRLALIREFLEELFDDTDMAAGSAATQGRDVRDLDGYANFTAALAAGDVRIIFLGVVIDLMTFRPDFSFLIIVGEGLRRLIYTNSDHRTARWLMPNQFEAEGKRLHKLRLDRLDSLLNESDSWLPQSVGMWKLFASQYEHLRSGPLSALGLPPINGVPASGDCLANGVSGVDH